MLVPNWRHSLLLLASLCGTLLVSGSARTEPADAGQPSRLSADEFAGLHRLIKPQVGESRWMEIDWHPTVWEARRKAAAEGKPLFLWAGSGGAPAAGC